VNRLSTPPWGAIDPEAATLVDLIGTDPRNLDFTRFRAALRSVAAADGYVSMNDMRRHLSNAHGLVIEPHRYSSFYRRACREGVIVWDELDPHCYELNDDARARNQGKPQRRYRLATGEAT
jgi:hypothetical protein